MNITLRHFEIVDAIAKCQGITRAASMLEMTQPALTRALQALEEEIGKELFTRTSRGLEPTEAANTFIKRYPTITSGMTEILNEIDRIKGLNGGKLTIATGLFSGHLLVYDAIAVMSRHYPELQFEIIQSDWHIVSKKILSNEIELGVMELGAAERDSEFKTELITEPKIHFFTRAEHPLTKLDVVTLSDLKNYPLCSSQFPARLTKFFGEDLGKLGQRNTLSGRLVPSIQVSNMSAIKQILSKSDAISAAPKPVVDRNLEGDKFVTLDQFDAPWLQTRYGFVHLRSRQLSPAILEFMAIIRAIEAGGQSSAGPAVAPALHEAKPSAPLTTDRHPS